MANVLIKDGTVNSVYVSGEGAGTNADPIILRRLASAKKASDGTITDLKCNDNGEQKIEVTVLAAPATLPLPSGAATSALQTAGNASLAAIAAEKVQLHAKIDFSSASAQTIIAAPGAGNRIRLTRLSMSSGGTPQVNVEIDMKSGANSIETVKGSVMAFDYPEHRNLGTNEAFIVQCTTADRVIGGVDYYVEAV